MAVEQNNSSSQNNLENDIDLGSLELPELDLDLENINVPEPSKIENGDFFSEVTSVENIEKFDSHSGTDELSLEGEDLLLPDLPNENPLDESSLDVTPEIKDMDSELDSHSFEPIEIDAEEDIPYASLEKERVSSGNIISEDITASHTNEKEEDGSTSLSEDELDEIIGELPDEDFEIEADKTKWENREDLTIPDEELVEKIIPEHEVVSREFQSSKNLEYEEIQSVRLSEVELGDDEMISLTPEELENIVSKEDLVEEKGEIETEIGGEDSEEEKDSLAEEDETIALTDDELENILSDGGLEKENLSHISDELKEEIEFDTEIDDKIGVEIEEEPLPEPLIEDETIALTDDELENILQDSTTEIQDMTISKSEIEEEIIVPPPDEIKVDSYIEEPKEEKREVLAKDIESEIGMNKEDLKKIIAYLDSLFDQLPESVIREFSRSEYFNLYKKVIESLGIYPPEEK